MSYGGVVVRGDEVIVIVPRGRRRVLGLPKGGPRPARRRSRPPRARCARRPASPHACATGSGRSTTRYRRGGRRIAKTVHFYLCEFEAGDTADHDHEVDDARWMPLREARRGSATPASAR